MARSLIRSLLVASTLWLLLLGAGAYLVYPHVGQVASSVAGNPFWEVQVTGDSSAPFKVELQAASWLTWSIAPIAALWLLAIVVRIASNRRSRRGA